MLRGSSLRAWPRSTQPAPPALAASRSARVSADPCERGRVHRQGNEREHRSSSALVEQPSRLRPRPAQRRTGIDLQPEPAMVHSGAGTGGGSIHAMRSRSRNPDRFLPRQSRSTATQRASPSLSGPGVGHSHTRRARHSDRIEAWTGGGLFSLSVINGGVPIPPEAREQLFQPFFRGSVRRSQQGLGLGLFIVSEIAKAHGGSMDVVSTDEQTRFTFSMPLNWIGDRPEEH